MDFNISEFPHRRMKPREAARVLGITEGTLRNMRLNGMGPVYYRRPGATETAMSARYYYLLSDVMQWMEENKGERVEPTVQHNAEVAYERKKTA